MTQEGHDVGLTAPVCRGPNPKVGRAAKRQVWASQSGWELTCWCFAVEHGLKLSLGAHHIAALVQRGAAPDGLCQWGRRLCCLEVPACSHTHITVFHGSRMCRRGLLCSLAVSCSLWNTFCNILCTASFRTACQHASAMKKSRRWPLSSNQAVRNKLKQALRRCRSM